MHTDDGKIIRPLLFSIFFLCILLLGLSYVFGYVVPPGTMGVRQITIGPEQGFSERGLRPGYHWSIPAYSRVHLIPTAVKTLHFDSERAKSGESAGALEVQTTDGATVGVDISVLTRFYTSSGEDDGIQHGGPSDLIRNLGTTSESWRNHVQRIAEHELKRSLAKLPTGSFYDPDLREAQVNEAFDQMRVRLATDGIKLEALLLKRYRYRASRIDTAIFEKNLQDQEERLNSASSRLAEARAELEQVAAEWDAKILTLQVEGENRANIIRSEGDLYESYKIAEGNLLIDEAVANVDKLRAQALTDSTAAHIYVARRASPIISSLRGGIVKGIDPYDLDAWMRKLGAYRYDQSDIGVAE